MKINNKSNDDAEPEVNNIYITAVYSATQMTT